MNRRPSDAYGRTLYGAWVHRDFYPLRWIPAPLILWLLHGHVPTLFIIVGVLAYSAMLAHTMVFLMPKDTVPRHLKRKTVGACPPSDGSRAPRSTR
ncbi:MAG: hypothetical protein EBR34_08705 [Sphingomonadaceae bacterium]|nr:hypothetical protein [Sphingomonadaceae bacterium]